MLRRQIQQDNSPLPDWIANPPELQEGLEFYYMAFWDLDSERSFGMGLGPIPRSKILAYAVEMELDQEGESDLLFLIRAMDNWHLKSQNKTDGG